MTDEGGASGHGGGGFALLLLAYREALEGFAGTLPAYASTIVAGLKIAPAEIGAALSRVTPGDHPAVPVAGAAALVLAGWLAQRAVRARLRGGALPRNRFALLARRILTEVLGLGAAAFVAGGMTAVLTPAPGPAQVFVLTYVTAGLCTLALAAASRLLLAPDVPQARLLPLDDAAARFLHRWLVRLGGFGIFAWLTAALLILSGMRMEAHLVLVLGIGTAAAGLAILMILRGRPLLAAIAPSSAGVCEVAATVYVVVIWLLWAESILARRPSAVWAAIGSVALVAALPLADRLFGQGVARIFEATDGEGGTRGYTEAVRRALRIALAGVAIILVPSLWGLDLLALAGAPGADVLSRALFHMGVTGLLAFLVWQLVDAALERRFLPVTPDGAGVSSAARLRTLKPLIRKFVLSVLVVVWMLIALSTLGVEIAPLLAGAGVIGIALGFGAQTLVRDIVSGIFFLWDDAFRVGEYVEAGELRGTVEAISLRSVKLRHHRGPVHTIPFGELKSLTNHSRDWVIVKLNLLVTYDTDVALVKKLLKGVGVELMQDPVTGPNLLEPLKSQGIYEMAENGLLIRAKFTARPGEQFAIRREAYQRIKQAFDEYGIKFAFPTVTINQPAVLADGGVPAADQASAAALVLHRNRAGSS